LQMRARCRILLGCKSVCNVPRMPERTRLQMLAISECYTQWQMCRVSLKLRLLVCAGSNCCDSSRNLNFTGSLHIGSLQTL